MGEFSFFSTAVRDYGAPPQQHPTKEDLFEFDWEQVDPRLLSEDLINESQSESDNNNKDDRHRQAEHCYFDTRKYNHGEKVNVGV